MRHLDVNASATLCKIILGENTRMVFCDTLLLKLPPTKENYILTVDEFIRSNRAYQEQDNLNTHEGGEVSLC
jgi:hypothetical protein